MAFTPGNFNWAALAGLASGNTVGEQLGAVNSTIASQQPQIAQQAQMNKTLAYLKQANPALAAQVEAGMPVSEAWQQVVQAQQPKKGQFVTLPDGTYGSWDGQTLNKIGTAQKPADLPAIADEYNWASQNGFKGTAQEYQAWKANLGKQKGMTVEYDPVNGFRMTQGDVDPKMPKLTESEGKNAGFYLRAKESNDLLTAVNPPKFGEDAVPSLENEGTSERNRLANNTPVAGNYIRSSEGQKYQQAKDNFITAVLRKESGAVIGETEYERENQKYFPQPNDGPEVIKQKRRARELAIEGLKIGSGPAKLDDQQSQQPSGVVPYTEFFK